MSNLLGRSVSHAALRHAYSDKDVLFTYKSPLTGRPVFHPADLSASQAVPRDLQVRGAQLSKP